MKTTMLYHAEAVGASGYLTLPVQETMEIQASAALPINGGSGSSSSNNFNHRNIFSFDSAQSMVIGSRSDGDAAYGSLSTVTITGLNIMGVVTCDQIVMRITTKHPDGAPEPSILPMGCYFEGLCIAGQDVEPDLSIDTFTTYDTWTALQDAYAKDPAVKAQLDQQSYIPPTGNTLPTSSRGVFGCTLVRNWGKLPAGVTPRNGGIYIPHFGTLTLGEFYVSQYSRRVMMLHVDLGCSVEGCYGGGVGGGNGFPFP
jgi:hypothetical protein